MNVIKLIFGVLLMAFIALLVMILAGRHNVKLDDVQVTNYIGLVITVLSFTVAVFLALMAISAVSHLSEIRNTSAKFDKLLADIDAEKETIKDFMTASSTFAAEYGLLFDVLVSDFKSLRAIDDSEGDATIRDAHINSISDRRISPLARFLIAVSDERTEIGRRDIVAQSLNILEKGTAADMRFAYEKIRKIDFGGKDGLLKQFYARMAR